MSFTFPVNIQHVTVNAVIQQHCVYHTIISHVHQVNKKILHVSKKNIFNFFPVISKIKFISYIHNTILKKMVYKHISKINFFGILNRKINENVSYEKHVQDFLSSVPFFDFYKDLKDKKYNSLLGDLIQNVVFAVPKAVTTCVKISPNPIDLVESNLDGSRFCSTIKRSVDCIKNIFSFNKNIENFIQDKVDCIKSNIEHPTSFLKKNLFFQYLKKNFNFRTSDYVDFPMMGSFFYHFDSRDISVQNDISVKKINDLRKNIKEICWVSLKSVNQLHSTVLFSKKIFHDAKNVINMRHGIIFPINIIIDGRNFSHQENRIMYINFKKNIPDIFLRKLIFTCFKNDLTSRPCLEIFYHAKKISNFSPEKCTVFYTINNIKDHRIHLTVTYLGKLTKVNKNDFLIDYKNFGAKTSVILSKYELPKINYFNFIN
ncbi:hypothetical protein [Buchnera aphidicola]|uniref:hypothetical protein n=1 Tax=Buchnera aphidicola TaxID=9 RepID=UPI0031B822E2